MQAIVFDFFGVICSEITPFVLPRYMSQEEAIAYKADIVEEADLGHIDLPEVLELLSQRTGASAAQLHAEFWQHVAINPEMVALIERLKGRYKIALLSNAMRPFLREVLARHQLERLFDVVVISAEIGLTKPGLPIYQHLIAALDLPAGECFFMDDNMVNVTAAKAAGIDAVLFTSVDVLKADLASRGV